MSDWQLAEAKNKFSQVFDLAFTEGPQRITRRRGKAVMMIDEEEYKKLTGKDQKMDFLEFLMSGPGLDELDLTRDKSLMRDIDL